MSLVQNQNAGLSQSPMIAATTSDPQPNTLVCQINPTGVAIYVAGQPVKLLALANSNQVIVEACASTADGPILGVIGYSQQKNIFAAGDQVEVLGRGNVTFLAAGGAITRGQTVSITPTGALGTDALVNADTTNGHYILGTALGQVAAAGSAIKVFIAPGIYTGGALAPTAP